MKAVIIVGGQGTRMRPLTDHLPKNIAPLCGVPFLTYPIEFLKKAGISDIVFSIGYRSDDIQRTYRDGKRLGVRIRYALEDTPLGTAGAVKNAEKFVKGSPVVVMNGDILTDIPLKKMIAFHRMAKNIASIGLVRVPDPTPYGLVLIDKKGRIFKFIEKPSKEEAVTNTINSGIYIFEPEVFSFIPDGIPYSSEHALFPGLLEAKKSFGGYVWNGYWQDIGTPRKYLTTHWDVLKGTFPVFAKLKRKPGKLYVGKKVKIGKNVTLKGPAILEDGCVLQDKAKVLPYAVLGKNCVIGEGSSIEKSVFWDGVQIGNQVQLKEVVLGRRCKIHDGAEVPLDLVLGDDAQV